MKAEFYIPASWDAACLSFPYLLFLLSHNQPQDWGRDGREDSNGLDIGYRERLFVNLSRGERMNCQSVSQSVNQQLLQAGSTSL